MTTIVVHGTIPVKVSHKVRWWWDSWHQHGFLAALAGAMESVDGAAHDVWKIRGQPVSELRALDPSGPSGWKAALDPNAWSDLMDPRRMLDAEQFLTHKGHFMWSGSDMHSERQRAGRTLARYMNEIHDLAPGDPISIVAHSHGCNAVKEASRSELLNPNVRIERAIFLACPHFAIQRTRRRAFPYALDRERFGVIFNAYSPVDSVQVDIAQNMPGPPEDMDHILGNLTSERMEQDPRVADVYLNYEIPTEDQGIRAHAALHGWRMGAMCGFWLRCNPNEVNEPYQDAFEQGIFPVPSGDHGE